MMKKKIKYLSLFLMLMFAGNKICFALTGQGSVYIQMPSVTDLIPGEISQPGEDPEPSDPYTKGNGPVDIGKGRYIYKYIQEIGTVTDIILDIYDMKGNLVDFKDTTNFKAGTWVGVNLKEVHTTNWSVSDFIYEEQVKKYKCKYERNVSPTCSWKTQSSEWTNSCSQGSWRGSGCSGVECKRIITDTRIIGSMVYYLCKFQVKTCTKSSTYTKTLTTTKKYNESYSCPEKHPDDVRYVLVDTEIDDDKTRSVTDSDVIKELKTKAINEVYNKAKKTGLHTASNIKYIYKNDYPREDVLLDSDDYKTITTSRLLRKEDTGIQTVTANKYGGKITREYEMIQEKVCINVKTSDVTYGRDCNKEEMQVKNETRINPYTNKSETIWHYFIPLNTPSNAYFDLKIEKNENAPAFSVERCEAYMQKHHTYDDNYKDTIIPAGQDNGVFTGNYDKCMKSKNKKCGDMILLKEAGGCRVVRSVGLPVTQEFYNEVEKKDGSKYFNGFNFYYKPIDINNPFPNGLASTSIWKTWNKSKKKTPDLSKSFSEITYTTKINENKIREYTKDNPYTSWENMYTTGVSSFIENKDMIERKVKLNSFYKLGCGPYNEDWGGCKK